MEAKMFQDWVLPKHGSDQLFFNLLSKNLEDEGESRAALRETDVTPRAVNKSGQRVLTDTKQSAFPALLQVQVLIRHRCWMHSSMLPQRALSLIGAAESAAI